METGAVSFSSHTVFLLSMKQLGHILTDKGSKYAVSGCPVSDRSMIDAALKSLKRDRSYARATHNTWGANLCEGGPIKGDDGEAGRGDGDSAHAGTRRAS